MPRWFLLQSTMLVVFLLGLLTPFSLPATAEPAITVTPSATSLPVYTMLELTITLPTTYANPSDPDQIDLQAVLTTPDSATERISLGWHQPVSPASP